MEPVDLNDNSDANPRVHCDIRLVPLPNPRLVTFGLSLLTNFAVYVTVRLAVWKFWESLEHDASV
jgi:hypothetical protein